MIKLPTFLSLLLISSVYINPLVLAKQYAAIFNFGDSLVDAGNLCVDGIPAYLATARLPYGMNFFGYPTGRCSDGRLIIDFIGIDIINTYFYLFFLVSLFVMIIWSQSHKLHRTLILTKHIYNSFPRCKFMHGERKIMRIHAINSHTIV